MSRPVLPRLALLLLLFLAGSAAPASGQTVAFTSVPQCGSATQWIAGTVTGIDDPANHAVALYVFVGRWWTKPTFSSPTLALTPTGPGTATFAGNFSSHPSDRESGYIAAFLVPAGQTPPRVEDAPALPRSLFDHPYAAVTRECDHRVLEAFGRAWYVKSSAEPVGPGPNLFSDDPGNVWVDPTGALHLRITEAAGVWSCAEVIDVTADPAKSSPGYGTYAFQTEGDLDALDPNVVLGLFTWDTFAPEYHYREIDFEAARWQNPADPTNAQFVVQPWNTAGNRHRFTLPAGAPASTHSFRWRADRVVFSSWLGATWSPAPGAEVASYEYTGPDVPPDGSDTANMRMNLWLTFGVPPTDGQETEVVIRDVAHVADRVTGTPGDVTRLPALAVAPNPARGAVRIRRSPAAPSGAAPVRVVDARGRVVARPGTLEPGGVITWDARDAGGRPLPGGIYFVVAGNDGAPAAKLLLLR